MTQIFAVLIPVALVTIALRQFPFSFAKVDSPLMALLSITMPVGVMTILCAYTFKDTGYLLYAALGIAITLLVHWWRRSAGLSIIVGTISYVARVNLLGA